jgi:murein L,D-transpeptidase YafK
MNLAQSEFLNVKYFIVALVLLGTVIFVALAKNTSQEPSTKIKNPRIVVKKRERVLELFDGEKLVKTYKVALGFAPEGDKEKQGDGKTPEGEFYIFTRNPKSKFYLSLGVSYPSAEDAERGLQTKLITKKEHDAIIKAINEKRTPPQYTALGGEIYIHGGGIGKDWTFGCVALENEEIKELYGIIPVGAPVTIQP